MLYLYFFIYCKNYSTWCLSWQYPNFLGSVKYPYEVRWWGGGLWSFPLHLPYDQTKEWHFFVPRLASCSQWASSAFNNSTVSKVCADSFCVQSGYLCHIKFKFFLAEYGKLFWMRFSHGSSGSCLEGNRCDLFLLFEEEPLSSLPLDNQWVESTLKPQVPNGLCVQLALNTLLCSDMLPMPAFTSQTFLSLWFFSDPTSPHWRIWIFKISRCSEGVMIYLLTYLFFILSRLCMRSLAWRGNYVMLQCHMLKCTGYWHIIKRDIGML